MRHGIQTRRQVIERGDEREYSRAGVGGAVHVANMNLTQRGLADAQHKRTLLFQANVRGTFDQRGRDAIGDAPERTDTAWNHDHCARRMRAAGNVGANVGVALLTNFVRVLPQKLLDQFVAAGEAKFFGDDAQAAVRHHKINALDASVSFRSHEQMFEEERSAGPCTGNRQIHECNSVGLLSIGTQESRSQGLAN